MGSGVQTVQNGGEKVTGIRRFEIRDSKFGIVLAFLVCTITLSGCGLFERDKPKEIERTAAEKEKAKLLSSIDRKFDNPQAHYELGRMYQAEGRWIKAEHEYQTALNFDPVYRKAQAARVKVLLDSGDKVKGELLADEYIGQASNSASGSLRLGLGFQKQALDEYALTCYQQALRLAPNSAKVNRQIGYYYLSKGNKDRGKDYLSRSFQLNPNQPDVAGELGRLGVVVKVPRKVQKQTKKLDKIVEESDKSYQEK